MFCFGGRPVPTACVVKTGFLALGLLSKLTIPENFLPHYPGLYWPTSERHTIPGTPTALGLLLVITNLFGQGEINQC